jgi:YbbR domain-containing protein
VTDLKNIFIKNYKVKISLFIVAIFLWFFITISGQYDTTFDLPLEIVGKKPGKVVMESVPKTVKVHCQDTGKQLLMFKLFSDASVRVDISSINYFYDYPLQVDNIQIPGGFHPKSINIVEPDTLKIRLDDLERKQVPIHSNVTILPKAGYALIGKPELVEDSVTIWGARSYVRGIREVLTDSVTFDDISGEFRKDIPLNIKDNRLESDINMVEVTARVDRLGQIDLENVPVVIEAVPFNRQVISEPTQVTLVVKGAVSLLRELRNDSLRAVINFRESWNPNIKLYQPKVELPDEVELVEMKPNQVHLDVIKK